MDELTTNEVQDGISEGLENMVDSAVETSGGDGEKTVEKATKVRKAKGKSPMEQGEGGEDHQISSESEKTEAKAKNKATSKTKEKKGAKSPTYTVEECGKNARQLGTSREVVLIALREAGKKESDLVSYAEAKVIIRQFLNREVK